MVNNFELSPEDIAQNIKQCRLWLQQNTHEALYVPSYDPYLNEYVPLHDCLRYYVTGFRGSVAEVLLTGDGQTKLFVDGRYYEQADREVDGAFVEVVKCGGDKSLFDYLLASLDHLGVKSLAIPSDRCPVSAIKQLDTYDVRLLEAGELEHLLKKREQMDLNPLLLADQAESLASRIERLHLGAKQAAFTSSLDSIAWLSGCRGYHLPFLSSFYARCLVIGDRPYFFIPEQVGLENIEAQLRSCFYVYKEKNGWQEELKTIWSEFQPESLKVDKQRMNYADYLFFKQLLPEESILDTEDLFHRLQAIKTPKEIELFRQSFAKGDQAIYQTIRWLQQAVDDGEKITERDLHRRTSDFYQSQGAISQSFNTIGGAQENGSIIHYSGAESKRVIAQNDLILLDSGGYFSQGLATDTTRTFIASEKFNTDQIDPLWIKLYTLVLKGHLQLMYGVFRQNTPGKVLDYVARKPLLQEGYDYAHGTGHGVGVYVHEAGVRLSPISDIPMSAGQVVSIEPGVYLPGKGGIRLESIAHVIEHPKYAGLLCFENLVYLGFEPRLIDYALLTQQEWQWLIDYECECEKRSTSFGVAEQMKSFKSGKVDILNQ